MKNKTKEIKLLPCPFCGGEAEICQYLHSFYVGCRECGVETFSENTKNKAIKRWNRRVKCKN